MDPLRIYVHMYVHVYIYKHMYMYVFFLFRACIYVNLLEGRFGVGMRSVLVRPMLGYPPWLKLRPRDPPERAPKKKKLFYASSYQKYFKGQHEFRVMACSGTK